MSNNQGMQDFLNTSAQAMGVDTTEPQEQRPEVSTREEMVKEVSLTAFSIDLWYPGCANEDDSDKLLVFAKDESELDEYLALFASATQYVQIVKEAEEKDGPMTAEAQFLCPRLYFNGSSPFAAQSVDIAVKINAMWWEYKFGCTDAEKTIQELIAASK